MTLRDAQRALAARGYDPGPLDGLMGPRTTAALRAYQLAEHLPVTGQLDAVTIEHLSRLRLTMPTWVRAADPGAWDSLAQMSSTIYLEAQGEGDLGMLGVGYVIATRATRWKVGIAGAIFGADLKAYDDGQPWETFSCWNDNERGQARRRLAMPDPAEAERAWRAAAAALWGMVPDPTRGASHYLNVELTRQIRPDHGLPAWFDPAKVTVKINRHTFLNLDA